ncbi:MAG: hypothetical protein KIT33_15645 [Candidatus Kapabacteria bacterium]|nr:hypothetical protein [Ignavibacteriota bacterium]MCW5886404.1 hypothetical protein [Candidatus Kapabacteria bacterium]
MDELIGIVTAVIGIGFFIIALLYIQRSFKMFNDVDKILKIVSEYIDKNKKGEL